MSLVPCFPAQMAVQEDPARRNSGMIVRVANSRPIVHVINGLYRGGAERTLVQVLLRSTREGARRHVVVTLLEGGDYASVLREAGIEVLSLGMTRGRPSIGALRDLTVLMRQLRPAMVMTWLYQADLLGTVANCLAGRCPVVWNLRCSDMDWSRYGRGTRVSAQILARISRFPAGVAANSVAGRRAHQAMGYRPRRWFYLPNGVDLELWHPDARDRADVRTNLGFGPDDIVLVMTARDDPKKDYPGLLEALRRVMPRYPHVRCVLIGRGTEHFDGGAGLNGRLVPLGERPDVPRLLRGCDIGVMSSGFGEGFPNAVAESMATGLPCVVTDVGDAARLVGRTGRIVPPRDPDALANAITSMLDMSPDRRRALGAQAIRRIHKRWSVDRAVRRYQRLWGAVIAGRV